MAKLYRIVAFLDKYLATDEVNDDSWNGLQVEGKPDVLKIVFAVDAGVETFERALEAGADLIIVHHGHFWQKADPSYSSWRKTRLDLLIKNGISLYASHLPLDRHPEVGNNAQLLKVLGAKKKEEAFEHHGKNVGWVGEFSTPQSMDAITKKLERQLGARCVVLPFGKKKVKTLAVLTGGGDYTTFFEALGMGVDLYITGDPSEIYHVAKDAGFNVVFAGHHATETLGVKALAEVLKKKFKVETAFIDIPTGL